ncbi:MAG: protein kinase domain-containing protein [Actinomycetes bacterium]
MDDPRPPGDARTNRTAGGTDPSGQVLGGRYRLERLIGSGGMAQVWESTDLVLGRKVAVKVLHSHLAADEAFVKRFRQEAVAAARLSHPNIVAVYDTVADPPFEAIVLELLDASTLRRTLDAHGVLDADTTLRISLRLLDALEVAHRNGVVHRDVKPSNILLCRDGRVKIADFGIAKADDQTELTRDGALIGTATYLAPEQLTDEPVDGRADLYSLSIVMYECLTGKVPFGGDTGAAIALARLHSVPTDPRRLRADIPVSIAGPVMRGLERWPDDRFGSAADYRAALLQQSPSGREVATALPTLHEGGDDPEYDTEPTMERESFSRSERSWLFPALGILLVAVAVAVAGLLFQRTTTDPVPDGAAATTTVTVAPEGALQLASVGTFDPQGDQRENDAATGTVADGNVATGWSTEVYNSASFTSSKDGVGLVLNLTGTSTVDRLEIDSAPDGWGGSVFVLPADGLENFDPDTAPPDGSVDRAASRVTVGLDGREGALVLLWLTDLGPENQSAQFQVTVNEARVFGSPR